MPSPTVSSCVLAISTNTLAAGLSTGTLFKIVAPSLVMVIFMLFGSPTLCKILSIPFGPNVVFTKSAMAMAPTNDDIRAFSPLCTSLLLAISPSALRVVAGGRKKGLRCGFRAFHGQPPFNCVKDVGEVATGSTGLDRTGARTGTHAFKNPSRRKKAKGGLRQKVPFD